MRRLRALTLLLLAASAFLTQTRLQPSAAPPPSEPQRRAGPGAQRGANQRARVDYSNFSHRTAQHRKECASCHRIPTPNWRAARAEDAFPDVTDFPGHSSCLGCHKQQFFRGARPSICSVCHTKVSPRDGSRFGFQQPDSIRRGAQSRETASEFATVFPHDRHQDVMAFAGGEAGGRASVVRASFQQSASATGPVDSCSACHRTFEPQGDSDVEEMAGRPASVEAKLWPKKGSFKTTPTDHASCFNCHWQEGGVEPLSTDCAACHRLLPAGGVPALTANTDADPAVAAHIASASIREKWLRRESAAFRHEVEKHEGIGCTGCHIQITSLSTLDPASLEVSILTCGGTGTGCHIKARPKAILNVEVDQRRADPKFQCAKCHVNFGRDATPKSHSDPVPAPRQ